MASANETTTFHQKKIMVPRNFDMAPILKFPQTAPRIPTNRLQKSYSLRELGFTVSVSMGFTVSISKNFGRVYSTVMSDV